MLGAGQLWRPTRRVEGEGLRPAATSTEEEGRRAQAVAVARAGPLDTSRKGAALNESNEEARIVVWLLRWNGVAWTKRC